MEKTVRRSHDRSSNKAAIHMVNAWCVENRISLGQIKTSDKSNEITAIPELIKTLELTGCIVTIALCAIICGADNWPEIESYGKAKYDWFKEFLQLPNGIPTQHTFRRFFIAVSVDELENCFLNWVKSVFDTSKSKVVPIDGKNRTPLP